MTRLFRFEKLDSKVYGFYVSSNVNVLEDTYCKWCPGLSFWIKRLPFTVFNCTCSLKIPSKHNFHLFTLLPKLWMCYWLFGLFIKHIPERDSTFQIDVPVVSSTARSFTRCCNFKNYFSAAVTFCHLSGLVSFKHCLQCDLYTITNIFCNYKQGLKFPN